MPRVIWGGAFPEELSENLGVLFKVREKQLYGLEDVEGQSAKFHINFYYGVIRSMSAHEDDKGHIIKSANIYNLDTVDMDKDKITPCFRNWTINEYDKNSFIMRVMDRIITERSYIFVPPPTDSVELIQI